MEKEKLKDICLCFKNRVTCVNMMQNSKKYAKFSHLKLQNQIFIKITDLLEHDWEHNTDKIEEKKLLQKLPQ